MSIRPQASAQPPARVSRARSLPHRWPFVRAVLFSALHYLVLVATGTAGIIFVLRAEESAFRLALAGLGFSVLTWFIAWFKRRGAWCPLCKGTPLVESGARPHSRARRLFPLNHGVTATLSILATLSFRCMYCGSDFDLLKTPSHLRNKR